jgi:hyperosmotically inducible periplasmic protein
MTKLALLLGGFLLLGTACSNTVRTSDAAPDSIDAAGGIVNQTTARTNQDDAVSELRRRQLNSDIRAREQRSQWFGDGAAKTDSDLASQVRSKLEANLPASALVINAQEGAITVAGAVVNQDQLQKIEPLAKEIRGVTSVTVNATISALPPLPPPPDSVQPIEAHTGS